MVTSLQLIYEIPLFSYVILGVYTIFQLIKARQSLTKDSPLNESYRWFILAGVFFLLWSLDHIYTDLVPLQENLRGFFHFVISHGFQIIGMICIAIAAKKTQKFTYQWKEKGRS